MGKGNRSRTSRELEIIENAANARNGGKDKTSILTWTGVVIVALLLVSAILLSCANNYGWVDKATTAVESDNFRISKSMLSYYVYSYYNNYYASYASYLGISTGTALDAQTVEEGSDETWFDYFADALAPQLKQILALCEGAKKAGIELDSADKAEIDSNIESIEEAASSYYYSLNTYIGYLYGTGVTESDVRTAMEYSTLSSKYYTILQEEKEASVTDDEITKYFDENPSEFLTADTMQFKLTATKTVADATATEAEEAAYTADKTTMSTKATEICSAATSADTFKAAVAAYLCGDYGEDLFDTTYESAASDLEDASKPADDVLAKAKTDVLTYCKSKLNGDDATAPDWGDAAYASVLSSACANVYSSLSTSYNSLDSDDVAYSDPTASSATDLNKWLFDSARKDNDVTVITAEGDTTSTYTVVFVKSVASRDTTITKNAAHILIQADGTNIAYDDDSTDYASAAAKTKAEEVLAEYNSSATQDLATFKTIGEKYTADSSVEYDNICKGDMVEAFENWIYDESRKAGDTEIIETSYGYHVMYFIGDGLETWKANAKDSVTSEKITEWYNDAYTTFGITLNSKLIAEDTTAD